MPFSIDSWKGQVKDNLPASMYELLVAPPVGGGQEILVRAESVSAPGVAFLSVDNYAPTGSGLIYNIPYKYNPQEVNIIHTVDEKAEIYKTYREWCNKIVDLDGSQKYGAYYLKDYAVDMNLTVYNRKQELAKMIQFIEAFPMSVEPMGLSWGQHDEVARFSVSYRFTRFKVLG